MSSRRTTEHEFRGGVEYLAVRRERLAEQVIPLYQQGLGHKSIAKQLGCSPRIARTILIEKGVYKPGALVNSEGHRQRVGEAAKARMLDADYKAAIRDAMLNSERTHALRAWLSERAEARRRERDYEQLYCSHFAPPRERKWASWMDQYRNDPQLRNAHLLRKRVRNMMQRGTESEDTLLLIGCSRAHFMAHIEAQFTEGMHWGNQGVGEGYWNLEHIRPLCDFDLTNVEHQRACFHWTNSRPLWALDNYSKGTKSDAEWRAAKALKG